MRISDWSSDVCSSDLRIERRQDFARQRAKGRLRRKRQGDRRAEVEMLLPMHIDVLRAVAIFDLVSCRSVIAGFVACNFLGSLLFLSPDPSSSPAHSVLLPSLHRSPSPFLLFFFFFFFFLLF